MRNVRRYFTAGNIYFLTHVTYLRAPILVANRDLLEGAIEKHRTAEPFDLIAWVILPDHWHFVVDVRHNRPDVLMKKIKLSFASLYRRREGMPSGQVWQNRYWDHVIRDKRDLNQHIDYVHYNPVKHALALSPAAYEHSSFREYVREGSYDESWGTVDSLHFGDRFGE
jgi:putative transposase